MNVLRVSVTTTELAVTRNVLEDVRIAPIIALLAETLVSRKLALRNVLKTL